MLKVLLRKQMTEIFRSYFYNPKKNTARSKSAVIAYILLFVVLMVGVLGGIFTMLSLSLCASFSAAGMDWLYFTLIGLLAIFLGVFGSVFNTYSSLYLAKDNDLLLSMPIPVRTIMTARLLGVYLMGLMYSGVVILPAVLVYWITVSAAPGVIFGSLLLMLLISVFVLTLSCILGWVVAKISQKLKNKSIITVLISVVFLAAYYFFYFKAQTIIEDLVVHAAQYGTVIRGSAYPLYLFGRVAVGDGAAMALVSAVVLAFFALTWLVLSRSFLKIATSPGRTARRVYKAEAAKCKSIRAALFFRELQHFTANPNYMLNCGLGILMLPVAGIALLIKGGALISTITDLFGLESGCTPLLLCTIVCFLASMNDMAVPSVSLEGKTLWMMQALPVTPWQVLRTKFSMQFVLTAPPALFCLICLAFIYPFTPVELVLAGITVLAFVLLNALFDLFLGVKMPNLTWTDEITPIKQSGSVLLALFGGFLYALALCGVYLAVGYKIGFSAYIGCFAALTVALSAVLYTWLKRKGTTRFAAL